MCVCPFDTYFICNVTWMWNSSETILGICVGVLEGRVLQHLHAESLDLGHRSLYFGHEIL